MLENNVLSYVATGNVGLVTTILNVATGNVGLVNIILKDRDQNTCCHCNLIPLAEVGCVCAGRSKSDKNNRRLFSNAVYFPE